MLRSLYKRSSSLCNIIPLVHGYATNHSTKVESMTLELKRDILFPSELSSKWTNQRWLSSASTRTLKRFGLVYRLIKANSIWSRDQICPRYMAIFTDPNLILILRPPNHKNEVRSLLHLPAELEESENSHGTSLMDSFLVAEVILDLLSCKLKLSKLTTPTSIWDDVHGQNFFELIAPSGNVHITLDDTSCPKDRVALMIETEQWEEAISQALFCAHQHSTSQQSTPGWKHHLVLGSLHSHVLQNQPLQLERIISHTRNLNLIDRKDLDGLTALHCACYNRNFMAIAALVSSGADCRMQTANAENQSPCHISAQLLDEKSLSLMLSTNRTRPDPNALDAMGRTPMYLAAVEGRNVHGSFHNSLLSQCLSLLEEWGGQMVIMDDKPSSVAHPVHVLATQRRFVDLPVVLSFSNYRFDLDDLGCETDDSSIASRFDYPIHACILSLRDYFMVSGGDETTYDFSNMEMSMVSSLQILLEHGLEPNERIEFDGSRSSFSAKLQPYIGFSPLQIIFTLHNHLNVQTSLFGLKKILVSAAEVLVEYGARMNIGCPPLERPHRKMSHSRQPDSHLDHRILGEFFDSEDQKNTALQAWAEAPFLFANWIMVHEDLLILPIPDSNLPGGSDHSSCSICWKDFSELSSSVIRERNICVLSKRYVCDECSRKGFSDGAVVFHISDGQYNLLRRDVDRRNAMDHPQFNSAIRSPEEDEMENEDFKNVELTEDNSFHFGHTISKFQTLVSKEVTNVTERLKAMIDDDTEGQGDAKNNVSSMDNPRGYTESKDGKRGKELLFEGGNSLFAGPQTRINGIDTEQVLANTRNVLNERGEKIASLAQKSASLRDKAHDFATLSKELRKGQESRGFFF